MAQENRFTPNRIISALLPMGVALALYSADFLPFWVIALIALGSMPSIVRLIMRADETSSERSGISGNIVNTSKGIDSVAPAIIDSLPDALLAVDGDMVVLESNQAARDLLGTGLRDSDLGLSLRHPEALRAIETALATAELVSLDLSIIGAGEQYLFMQVMPVSILSDRANKPDVSSELEGGAIVVLHDVTAQKKSEKMRADFVTNASHELRTPLATLVGFIETLQTAAADDPKARSRFLGIMARESGRMSRLIDDLLSLSRIELDEHVRPTGTVLLDQILSSAEEMLEHKAKGQHMGIILDVPGELPAVIGDYDQLMQVFQNLIDNAIKYGAENTDICITVSTIDRLPGTGHAGLSVEVANQGNVIPSEHLPHLTDRFYRVDNARSRELGSTGLGLAIVKHIVSRHRGTLSIESNAEAGTRIKIGLPTDKAN